MADHKHSIITPENLFAADRLRTILLEIDNETTDATLAATTVNVCLAQFTANKYPVGVDGSDVVALTDDEATLLVHHASTAEGAIRRVGTAMTEARTVADTLPTAGVAVFDPIVAHVRRYHARRLEMEAGDLSDEEAITLHREAIAPLSGETPPEVRSMQGATEVLRLLVSFNDMDPVDSNLVRGVLAFLERRA